MADCFAALCSPQALTDADPFAQDLGYQGDASYSQFLYPNEQEVRKMMRWIVQTLPKNEEGGDGNDEAAPGDAVPEIIAAGLRAWAQQLWVFPMADK